MKTSRQFMFIGALWGWAISALFMWVPKFPTHEISAISLVVFAGLIMGAAISGIYWWTRLTHGDLQIADDSLFWEDTSKNHRHTVKLAIEMLLLQIGIGIIANDIGGEWMILAAGSHAFVVCIVPLMMHFNFDMRRGDLQNHWRSMIFGAITAICGVITFAPISKVSGLPLGAMLSTMLCGTLVCWCVVAICYFVDMKFPGQSSANDICIISFVAGCIISTAVMESTPLVIMWNSGAALCIALAALCLGWHLRSSEVEENIRPAEAAPATA